MTNFEILTLAIAFITLLQTLLIPYFTRLNTRHKQTQKDIKQLQEQQNKQDTSIQIMQETKIDFNQFAIFDADIKKYIKQENKDLKKDIKEILNHYFNAKKESL